MYLTIQLNLSLLLYGCEIWGSFNPTTARFKNETIT
jgi:hypothetical protein